MFSSSCFSNQNQGVGIGCAPVLRLVCWTSRYYTNSFTFNVKAGCSAGGCESMCSRPPGSRFLLSQFGEKSMGRVVASYPEDCAVEYDYTTCTFKEVMKNGYNGPCYYQAVRK
ncbi:hypothetical protein NFI96_023080 [Prochilodus magdalenae]|nr:hypothetical protein NFI96_023080 [Prochilodus magdalenae]